MTLSWEEWQKFLHEEKTKDGFDIYGNSRIGYIYVHPSAIIGTTTKIGSGTTVQRNSCIRSGVSVGVGCDIGKDSNILYDIPDFTSTLVTT